MKILADTNCTLAFSSYPNDSRFTTIQLHCVTLEQIIQRNKMKMNYFCFVPHRVVSGDVPFTPCYTS